MLLRRECSISVMETTGTKMGTTKLGIEHTEALNSDAVMFKLQIDGRLKLALTPWGWCSMPRGYEVSDISEGDIESDPQLCRWTDKRLAKALGIKLARASEAR